ncbi:MAG: hypothetical protein ABI068_05970 [Ktedonobacterales bacterium]
MESLHIPANTQRTFSTKEQATPTTHTPEHDTPSQSEESCEATIIRLDQHAAEQLFRKAGIPGL